MLYGGDGINTNGYRYNQTTSRQLDEPTQKLFKAIDDENLEGFKQALAEGADVNAFDKEGMTPLVSIVTNLSAGFKKEYQNMIRLLLLYQRIDVNICEKSNDDTALHLAMCFQQKKTLQLLLSHPNINTNNPSCGLLNTVKHRNTVFFGCMEYETSVEKTCTKKFIGDLWRVCSSSNIFFR